MSESEQTSSEEQFLSTTDQEVSNAPRILVEVHKKPNYRRKRRTSYPNRTGKKKKQKQLFSPDAAEVRSGACAEAVRETAQAYMDAIHNSEATQRKVASVVTQVMRTNANLGPHKQMAAGLAAGMKTYSSIVQNGLREEATCAAIRFASQIPDMPDETIVQNSATQAWKAIKIPYKNTVKRNPLRSERGGTSAQQRARRRWLAEQEKLLLEPEYNPQRLASAVKTRFQRQRAVRANNNHEQREREIPDPQEEEEEEEEPTQEEEKEIDQPQEVEVEEPTQEAEKEMDQPQEVEVEEPTQEAEKEIDQQQEEVSQDDQHESEQQFPFPRRRRIYFYFRREKEFQHGGAEQETPEPREHEAPTHQDEEIEASHEEEILPRQEHEEGIPYPEQQQQPDQEQPLLAVEAPITQDTDYIGIKHRQIFPKDCEDLVHLMENDDASITLKDPEWGKNLPVGQLPEWIDNTPDNCILFRQCVFYAGLWGLNQWERLNESKARPTLAERFSCSVSVASACLANLLGRYLPCRVSLNRRPTINEILHLREGIFLVSPPTSGWGITLTATHHYRPGTKVIDYPGVILDAQEAEQQKNLRKRYHAPLNFIQVPGKGVLDPDNVQTSFGHYINAPNRQGRNEENNLTVCFFSFLFTLYLYLTRYALIQQMARHPSRQHAQLMWAILSS